MSKVCFIFNYSPKAKSKVTLSGKGLTRVTAYISGPNIDCVRRKYDKLCTNMLVAVGPFFPGKVRGCKEYAGIAQFNETHVRAFVNFMQKKCLANKICPNDSLLLSMCVVECEESVKYGERILAIYKTG